MQLASNLVGSWQLLCVCAVKDGLKCFLHKTCSKERQHSAYFGSQVSAARLQSLRLQPLAFRKNVKRSHSSQLVLLLNTLWQVLQRPLNGVHVAHQMILDVYVTCEKPNYDTTLLLTAAGQLIVFCTFAYNPNCCLFIGPVPSPYNSYLDLTEQQQTAAHSFFIFLQTYSRNLTFSRIQTRISDCK